MNCQRITGMLSALQDGELSPSRRQEVESHLRDCAACRGERDGLLKLDRRLRLEPAPLADPFFSARVMARLRPGPVRQRRWLQAAAYALVFAAIFLGGFILQTTGSNGAPPATAISYSAVLQEPQGLGLMAIHDDSLGLFAGERP